MLSSRLKIEFCEEGKIIFLKKVQEVRKYAGLDFHADALEASGRNFVHQS